MPKKSPQKKKKIDVPDKVKLLLQTPDFIEFLTVCREELGIEPDGFKTHEKVMNFMEKTKLKIDSKVKGYTFLDAVQMILVLSRLPEYYDDFITFYLLQGQQYPQLIQKKRIKISTKKDRRGHGLVVIEIAPNVRKDEFVDRWSDIAKFQRQISSNVKNQPLKTSKRDLRLLQLKKDKLSQEEIFRRINADFPESPLKEATHVAYRLSKIKEMLENLD
jgi:hypothetical protein